ncbi:8088_t:CDS:2, partial [Scutellospora calospora]
KLGAMPSLATKKSNGNTVLLITIPAKFVSYAHTALGYCAFLFAFFVGCYTHYHKIVKNEFYGYPDEWFPSVSATTGDWYPERAVFQIIIALASGPRFMLVFLWFLLITKSHPTGSLGFAKFLLVIGLIRTFSCGGWVYITSSDDHDVHDIAMITYLICTLPWMLGVLSTTPQISYNSLKYRRWLCIAFFATLVPMIYFYIQHKVHRIKTAYTYYSFFEWSLILYDVAFDSITSFDFKSFQLAIVDVSGTSVIAENHAGYNNTAYKSSLARFFRIFTEIFSFVTDIYLAFVFWSMLTALALLIWYFPLWHMGISGYEVFLLVTVTPGFLAFNIVRRIVFKYRGFLHLLSLFGVASYTINDPASRLMASAFGIGISLLTWVGTWIGNRSDNGLLEYDISVWSLGLLLHNVVKMAWYSNNPVWPIMNEFNGGKNVIGLLFGILACIGLIIRDINYGKSKLTDRLSANNLPEISESWIFASFGLGAIMFGLHSMFTDSSTIMRWVVDGYPNYGPNPVPWGAVTILALGIGLLISTNSKFSTSLSLYGVGCFCCTIIYFIPSWIGYYAGLILGTYFMAIVPYFIRSAILHSPGRTMFTAMMVYNIFCLAHVWVVAYEFVPGGPLARERTNWILIFMMAFIGLGVRNASSAIKHYKHTQLKMIRSVRYYTRMAVFTIIILSISVAFARYTSAKTPVPYRPEHKLFTAGIWTIHFTLDNDMWSSEVRIRDIIRDLELDVVGLLESDTHRIIMGNRDLWQYISEDLGYYLDYGPGPSKHTWGCAMLSKFPIINSTHHLLPSPVGELACAIHATLDVYGQHVDFIVSHNGQEENQLDRELQSIELARIMRQSSNPFVFLGYVVTEPFQHVYNILFNDGHINDIDPSETDRWCEYIGYRGLKRIAFARVSHGAITDTEIQVGKFLVINDPNDNSIISNTQVSKNHYPVSMRFSEKLYNEGIRGHRYDDSYP